VGLRMAEQAFNGTIKEGFKRRFTILNEADYQKYIDEDLKENFEEVFNEVLGKIEIGRVSDGKKPYNNYVVINLDEPYIDEIVAIMKRNGHWG
jgi:hypothetical protein